MEPTVALDIKDQIEFARILVGQEVAAFRSGGVQQHIDVSAAFSHLPDDLGYSVCVREVDAEVMRRTASGSYRSDRAVRCLRSLQGCQLFFHEGRRGAFATRLDACEQIT